jgi:hypothetical protein
MQRCRAASTRGIAGTCTCTSPPSRVKQLMDMNATKQRDDLCNTPNLIVTLRLKAALDKEVGVS